MNVSTKQQRIEELAKRSPETSFTSLNHYLDLDWLEAAYRRLGKDSAPGYDAQTVQDYGEELEANLHALLGRAKSGSYFAPPVRRVYVPKGTGKETRPIGVPSTEDKLLQRAVAMLLEPIYEQDFLDCSYGFRPGRSAHDALESLWHQCMDLRVGWILDVDIANFCDTLVHAHLREFLRHRMRDGVISRLVGKWLNAGVLEQGAVHYPEAGSPQGGVISPQLSNTYLHYVTDLWFAEVVRPRMGARVSMVCLPTTLSWGLSTKRMRRACWAYSASDSGSTAFRCTPLRLDWFRLVVLQDATKPNRVPSSFWALPISGAGVVEGSGLCGARPRVTGCVEDLPG